MSKKKIILNGNTALAYGAIEAGVSLFAGYPITPSTDVYEVLEVLLPKIGGIFLSAESEIAAINMVIGATIAGARAMTCTSGCGFSLMQESISYMAADFVPLVVLNVMREGAGLGDIPRSQGDYNQMTKGGGNGDYHSIVLSCSTINDCYKMPKLAFELAEKYRNPVIITYDSDIAHIEENIEIEEATLKLIDRNGNEPWILNGFDGKNHKTIQNVYYHNTKYDEILKEKYDIIEINEQLYDGYMLDDAEVVFVGFSICARILRETINILRNKNVKAGLIIPITLYPFPNDAFLNLKNVKKVVVVELNILGQMKKDVLLALANAGRNDVKVSSVNYMSKVPTINEIISKAGEDYV